MYLASQHIKGSPAWLAETALGKLIRVFPKVKKPLTELPHMTLLSLQRAEAFIACSGVSGLSDHCEAH